MAVKRGPQVPPAVGRLLEDEPDRHVGLTILVLSTGDDGWPHQAMISVGELLVTAADRFALALWPSSTCAANLSRTKRVTLALVADGSAFSLLCEVRVERPLDVGADRPLRAFDLRVVEVIEDAAPYADLLTGVTYSLHDRAGTLARWTATRAALRATFDVALRS